MTALTVRTMEQRHQALEVANAIRIARSHLKRELAGRRITVTAILDGPPAYVLSMKVYDLLLAQRRWGHVKVCKTLNAARISPVKTIGGLTSRQRRELAGLLS